MIATRRTPSRVLTRQRRGHPTANDKEKTMVSHPQQQAITHCLTGIDLHAHHNYPWPGPVLLAALRDTPVPGHPDPTARHLGVAPVPVPPATWQHPDGPVAALRQVTADLHHPVIQATVSLASPANVRVLAWVFMRATVIDDEELGTIQVRFVDAVDIDDTAYVLTHLPNQPHGLIAVHDASTDHSTTDTIAVLRALAATIRTNQAENGPQHPATHGQSLPSQPRL
jgi:hypothetical protein